MPKNADMMAGNCLIPETFDNQLLDTQAVIHCVGGLFPSKKYERSYIALNRDSCINMATGLQKHAKNQGQIRNFVMVSASRQPPWSSEYLTTKQEAEKFLLNECPNLRVTIMRPGVIVNYQERWWSMPIGLYCMYVDFLWTRFYSKIPGTKRIESRVPDRPTKLITLTDIAIHGALGLNDQKEFNRDDFIAWETDHDLS